MSRSNESTARRPSDPWWLLKDIYAFRFEITCVAVLVAIGVGSLMLGSGRVALGAIVLVVAAVASLPRSRTFVIEAGHASRLRRKVARMFTERAGVLAQRPPRITKVERTVIGDRVEARLQRGTALRDVEAVLDVLAAGLGVRDVRVGANTDRRDRVTIEIVRHDPFGSASGRAPSLAWSSRSVRKPIPVGVDEHGDTVTMSIVERSLLLGGEPGSGKSVALANLVAACVLDRTVNLYLLDGKLVELIAWKDCARGFVGPDVEEAITVLERVRSEMDRRYRWLEERGLRKISDTDHLTVVVIDELAVYVSGPDKKLATRFSELLRDIVSRGRAAGFVVLAATQRPSADVVPSSLRDLFSIRWAMRCTTREASDTILGSGWAAQGYSAAEFAISTRGVGFLLHDGEVPIRVRSFVLSDDDVRALAARAYQLRWSIFDPRS